MLKKTRNKLICVCLFIAGLGCCIAGIFVPGLMAIGGTLLAGALGMIPSIIQEKDKVVVNNNYTPPVTPVPTSAPTPANTPRNSYIHEAPTKRSLLGFKSKKFMKHHEGRDRPEPMEADAMHVPHELLAQINRLRDTFESIDLDQINKVLQANQQKETSNVTPTGIN